jgi:hypothetical protein
MVANTIRELQAPLLAAVLLGACAAKLAQALRPAAAAAVPGAALLLAPRLRLLATITLCAVEFALGTALIVTAGREGAGGWADGVRAATALFFLVSMCALMELRDRRPGAGCGCFGSLSAQAPGIRAIARAGMLAAAALAAVDASPLSLPPPGPLAAVSFGLLAVELLVLAVLSPELGEALARLGYLEPCEMRVQPPGRPLAALRRSTAWREHAVLVTAREPTDIWRELCWWYLVFPARDEGGECQVVFAVEVRRHRPGIRAALVREGPPRGQAGPARRRSQAGPARPRSQAGPARPRPQVPAAARPPSAPPGQPLPGPVAAEPVAAEPVAAEPVVSLPGPPSASF